VTTLIGAHVHPLGHPDVDLTVDVVGHLSDGHELLRTHDAAGLTVYLCGADCVTDTPRGVR
jgi:hypothetical protein